MCFSRISGIVKCSHLFLKACYQDKAIPNAYFHFLKILVIAFVLRIKFLVVNTLNTHTGRGLRTLKMLF